MKQRAHSQYRLRGMLAALALLLLVPTFGRADETEDRQYKIEAVFLYNFFNYITWPGHTSPEDMKQATICVVGNAPLLPYLQYVQERMSAERHLNVRNVRSAQDAAGCQMLFDPAGNGGAPAVGVLSISNQHDYLNRGGMIVLTHEGDHVGIDVDNTRLAQQGFQVSSRLLKLAEEVK